MWREALYEVLIDSDSLVFTCGMDHSHGGVSPPSHKAEESAVRNSPAKLDSTLLCNRTELKVEKTTTPQKTLLAQWSCLACSLGVLSVSAFSECLLSTLYFLEKQSDCIFVVIVYSGDMTDMASVTNMEPSRTAHRVARRRSRRSFVFHAYCEI